MMGSCHVLQPKPYDFADLRDGGGEFGRPVVLQLRRHRSQDAGLVGKPDAVDEREGEFLGVPATTQGECSNSSP
jgi:hypothetical protein